MQVLRSAGLLPYIKHYLFFERKGDAIKKLRLFSDGNTGMVFCLKECLISTGTSSLLPNSFVYGQLSEFKDLYLTSDASFIVVVFQPDGLYKLLGMPANELRDSIVHTADIFGSEGVLLHDTLMNLPKPEDRLYALNVFFREAAAKQTPPSPVLVQALLNFIILHKGVVTVQQLIKYAGYTERHIERVFGENVGISPKKFGNIVKLHAFLKLLKNKSPQNNLTPMCYDSGYFDQSHLIREFKKYTGITPTEYLHNTSRLATNFMEFNAALNPMSGLYNLPG